MEDVCDDDVDIADIQRLAACWQQPTNAFCPALLDIDLSGAIDIADVIAVAEQWGWRIGQ